MIIYIHKNNSQMGPFDEAKVLQMLSSGELSPNDMAIRQGEQQWQKLENLYPRAGKQTAAKIESNVRPAPAVVEAPVAAPIQSELAKPKKSRKGLLLGCSGFFLIALLVASVLGFLAYRNMNPADSTEAMPDSVTTPLDGEFKLLHRGSPKGNVWGTEQNFMGVYQNDSKTRSVIYLATVYKDEATAKAALQTELDRTCKSGEESMKFSFAPESGGSEVSQAATCAVPLYIQHSNKLIALGGNGASVDTWIEFAENLSFNKGTKMKKKK